MPTGSNTKAKKKKKSPAGATTAHLEKAMSKVEIRLCQKSEFQFIFHFCFSKTKVENLPAPVDPSKKLRNLKKLLKAIEGLEAKVKSEEGFNLEPEQQEKIARKPEILKEIFSLEMEVN